MKKNLGYLLVTLLMAKSKAFALCSIEDAMRPAHTEPNYLSVFMALAFVILLIYITGIVYTKLNLLGSKVVKNSRKKFEDDRVFIISTTPLSNNKSLHVIEINGQKFLIGVSQNNISMLKELGASTSAEEEFKPEIETKKEEDGLSEIYEEQVQDKNDDDEDFGLYKKYL